MCVSFELVAHGMGNNGENPDTQNTLNILILDSQTRNRIGCLISR